MCACAFFKCTYYYHKCALIRNSLYLDLATMSALSMRTEFVRWSAVETLVPSLKLTKHTFDGTPRAAKSLHEQMYINLKITNE